MKLPIFPQLLVYQVTVWACEWHLKLWEGQFCKIEPLICEIWCYLQVFTVRIKLTPRIPNWCPRIAWWCGSLLLTLKLGWLMSSFQWQQAGHRRKSQCVLGLQQPSYNGCTVHQEEESQIQSSGIHSLPILITTCCRQHHALHRSSRSLRLAGKSVKVSS